MEFRSGGNPKNSTTKPVDSRLLRTRAIFSDSSGSFGIPQAYLGYPVGASGQAPEPKQHAAQGENLFPPLKAHFKQLGYKVYADIEASPGA
jgi:hypothetical protein